MRATRCGTGRPSIQSASPETGSAPAEQLLGQRIGIGTAHFLHSSAGRTCAARLDLDTGNRGAQRRCQLENLLRAANFKVEAAGDAFALLAEAR